MQSCEPYFTKLTEAFTALCPFIDFATILVPEKDNELCCLKPCELFVYTADSTSRWAALEKILAAIALSDSAYACDVILLNRADVFTRYRASQSDCLLIRQGKEEDFKRFRKQASLDHRIIRARGRQLGIIDNL